jgi:hypothetical protein
VPVRAVPWEPNWEPADDLRDPAEAIVRASGLPSAPASALREVTHAADTRAVCNGQIAEYERHCNGAPQRVAAHRLSSSERAGCIPGPLHGDQMSASEVATRPAKR